MTSNKSLATLTVTILALASPVQADSTKFVNPANGHQYQRIDSKDSNYITWETARDYCKSVGGHLATPTSKSENDFIFNNLGDYSMWLGGTDNNGGAWVWITNEVWRYTNWASGQPDSYGGPDQHLIMWVGHNGQWADASNPPSDFPFYSFSCEWDNAQYLGVTAIPDVNGDGMMDQAVLAMISGNYYLRTIDSSTGKQLKQVALGAATTITPSALTAVDKQISVLITKSTDRSILQLRDNATLAIVKTLTLPK